MRCPWCGKEGMAGQCGNGFCDVEEKYRWVRWYCDPKSGCGIMWEYGEDGTGFVKSLLGPMRKVAEVELDGQMVVYSGVEV